MTRCVPIVLPIIRWLAHLGDARRSRFPELFAGGRVVDAATRPRNPPGTNALLGLLQSRLSRHLVWAAWVQLGGLLFAMLLRSVGEWRRKSLW